MQEDTVTAEPAVESWTEDKVIQLIEAYRTREILWNPQNESFYKKHLKLDAWLEIANLMETTKEKCNNKIISLLSSYRREKLRVKKSKGTGKGASETYTSRWFAYDALKFLDDRNKLRKRMNSVVVQQHAQENPQNEFTAPSQRNEYIPTRVKQAKKDDNSSVLSDVVGILQTTATKLGSSGASDLTTTFASYVSSKMKTYSPLTRNSVEHAIFEVLMKADKGYYESSCRQHGYHPTSYQESYCATPKTREDYVDLGGYVDRPGTSAFRHPTSAPPPDTNQQARYDYTTVRNEEYDMEQQPSSVTSLESQQSLDDFNDLM